MMADLILKGRTCDPEMWITRVCWEALLGFSGFKYIKNKCNYALLFCAFILMCYVFLKHAANWSPCKTAEDRITVMQLLLSQNVMDPLKNAVVVHWSAAGQKWDWFGDKKKKTKTGSSRHVRTFDWDQWKVISLFQVLFLLEVSATLGRCVRVSYLFNMQPQFQKCYRLILFHTPGLFTLQASFNCHDSAPLPLGFLGRHLLAAPWLGAQGPGWAAAARDLAASALCPGSCCTLPRSAEPPRQQHPHHTAWS